jgi:hypothetical protein
VTSAATATERILEVAGSPARTDVFNEKAMGASAASPLSGIWLLEHVESFR